MMDEYLTAVRVLLKANEATDAAQAAYETADAELATCQRVARMAQDQEQAARRALWESLT